MNEAQEAVSTFNQFKIQGSYLRVAMGLTPAEKAARAKQKNVSTSYLNVIHNKKNVFYFCFVITYLLLCLT